MLLPIYTETSALAVGQKVEGEHFGSLRQGEVIQANERHFVVRWVNGVRNTCMQGFDYGADLRAIGEAA